ncbi:MAG: murein transglycosylase A [Rhodospirillaceae bacterium]|jgi:membrane-bound lytic murein transglycosylase A|nr:murein transglycosylase A [Rhodospirillaceae bacterium]MBT7956452.1 murein transglycosylase A [Rhodospirillaceae bacterium]
MSFSPAKYLVLFVFLVLAGCSQFDGPRKPAKPATPSLGLSPLNFAQIQDWQRDNHAQSFGAFLRSCSKIVKQPANRQLGKDGFAGQIGNWQQICRAAREFGATISPDNARRFFESWFYAYRLTDNGRPDGLITGYYEPELRGSRRPSRKYHVALYRRPPDLVSANLGQFRKDWKGREVAGRLKNGRLVPYANRASISQGALNGKNLELLWVDNAIDAFFLHIQGSGRVVLDSGEVVRVGYAGRNGLPYFAIGRDLVKSGAIAKENISLQSIRAWLERNPGRAAALMNKNKSFVFFRELKGRAGKNIGPIGAQGVALTPGRSLAVDRKYLPMGAPIWLDTSDPLTNRPIRRLMITQDTGGAITGPVRGDFFWGAGERAREAAGRMKQSGQLYILLPRSIRR